MPAYWKRSLPSLLLALASVLAGCYAMSTLQEPHTVAPGKVRLGPQARVTQGRLNGANVRPAIDVQLRVGLRDRLELQLLGSTAGTGRLGVKALLVDWPSFMLAIVPSYQIQYMVEDSDDVLDEDFLPEYLVHTVIAPVIVGVPVASQLDLLFGVDAHAGYRDQLRHWAGESGPVLAFGAHAGLAVHGRNERLTFVPQCGVLVGALSAKSDSSPSYGDYRFDALRRGSLRWECALGINFGAKYAQRAR